MAPSKSVRDIAIQYSRRSRVNLWIFSAAFVAALLLDAISAAHANNALVRMWDDLLARPSGPGAFRFYLQPTMAMIAAFKDGIKDARIDRSPYFWTVLHIPAERKARLVEGLKSTARIILLGIAMDAIYQYSVLKAFRPTEMILIVLLLAFVPYLLLRGPICRAARWWMSRRRSNVIGT